VSSNADACSRCGHDRVFHRLGTGNGVAVGKAFCDDRHAPPCDCAGFVALPIGQAFALTGRWRVYFNRHGAADRPWCVAPEAGGWEVAVRSVGISTVAETVYQPKAVPDDEDGRPSAWIAVDGYLTIHMSGHASIGAP